MENRNMEGGFISKEEVKVAEEQNKKAKKVKKRSDRPGFFKRLGMKIKDIFSELKKVSWPSFGKVVKQTGVVLVVVLAFLVVITAFDFGLLKLLGLIVPKA